MKHFVIYIICLLTFLNSLLAQETFATTIDGHERTYTVYIPIDIPENAPLVFVLHGYGGDAKSMMEYATMNPLADQHKFAVCYPQGNFGLDEKNSWNAGYSNDDIDDVKFLSTLAKALQRKYSLSLQNTFCTGMSNGADMSYVLACEAPHIFRAIASVAGCMMESTYRRCMNSIPVPIFEIHGTDDEITLWNGDPYYSEKYGAYLGTENIVKFWADHNVCREITQDTLVNKNTADGSYVTTTKYTSVIHNREVWLYTLVNGKHDWPGSWGNMDFIASEAIWSFFSKHLRK